MKARLADSVVALADACGKITALSEELTSLEVELDQAYENVEEQQWTVQDAQYTISTGRRVRREQVRLEETNASAMTSNIALKKEVGLLQEENQELGTKLAGLGKGIGFAERDATRAREQQLKVEGERSRLQAQLEELDALLRENADPTRHGDSDVEMADVNDEAEEQGKTVNPSLRAVMQDFKARLNERKRQTPLAEGKEYKLPWTLNDLVGAVGEDCPITQFVTELVDMKDVDPNAEIKAFVITYIIWGLLNCKATAAKLAITRVLVRRGPSTYCLDTLARLNITLSKSGY